MRTLVALVSRRLAVAVGLAGLAALGAAPAADAGTCGGAVPCRCGDTVARTAVLTADLGVCPGIGLRVKSGVTLDCNGHLLTGSDLSGAKYGVLVPRGVGAVVKNCRITKFRRGIRLDGGRDNTVAGNEVFANKYGIDLAGGTLANRIVQNDVHDNRDEGIHVGTGAHDTVITRNVLKRNKLEGIYLLRADRCQVTDNDISSGDKAGVFVKHSDDSYVAGNLVYGRVQVRGDSAGNVFEDNHLRGNGYLFEAYEEPAGVWGYPHDNRVTGGLVENTRLCLRFAGAYDNTVERLQLEQGCNPPAMWAVGGQEPTGNEIDVIVVP